VGVGLEAGFVVGFGVGRGVGFAVGFAVGVAFAGDVGFSVVPEVGLDSLTDGAVDPCAGGVA
jgi:hypothetical protein